MAGPWEKYKAAPAAAAGPWAKYAQPAEQPAPEQEEKREVGTYEAILPRAAQASREGAGIGRQALGAGLDALSLPGRFAASTAGQIGQGDRGAGSFGQYAGMPKTQPAAQPRTGETFNQAMADTEGKGLGRIVRDPALLPSIATGGLALGAAAKLGLTGLKGISAAGAATGAGSAAIHQADNVSQGKDVNAGSAALEVAAGAAFPYAAKGAGMMVHGGNKLLGRFAQEFSGVSEEALRKHGAGLGQGAKDLAAAAGKQHEIGQKLVKVLDNLDDYLPEKNIVDQALQQMPPVNVTNTLGVLRQAKTGGALSSSRAVNDKIDGLISDLQGAADESGNIAAPTFRQIRKEIDDLVGDAFGKESGQYVTALKQARYQMADDLVKTAEAGGNPEYVDAMKTMAQKLQAADKLKSFLGKSAQTRETRAESFVSTLFGKNKEDRQNAVKAMEELFGGDFTAEAKLANLAAELGEGGKAGFLPRQFTGRAALGPTVAALGGHFVNPVAAAPALALSSPRVAAGMLAGSGAVDRVVNKGVSALEKFGTRGVPAAAAPLRQPDPDLGINLEAIRQPLDMNAAGAPLGRRVIPQPNVRRSLAPPPQAPRQGLPPRESILKYDRRPLESYQPDQIGVDEFGAVRAAEAERSLAPLPPRRPIGNIPSNPPTSGPESEAVRRILNNAGRRELPNQALARIEEALKTAKGPERVQLLNERAAINWKGDK